MRTTTLKAWGSFALATWCFAASAVDRYVSLTGGHVPPFTTWANAATNIQAAIDAAAVGETVWVTNGIYNSGGKVKGGNLTNRVAIDKSLTVKSVNGPAVTTIQGAWSPNTNNGPLAVRCAWLTNGTNLSGFTLINGATRSLTLSPDQQMNGGGVWGSSTNAIVSNCVIATNTAAYGGGGAYQVTLRDCTLIGNRAIGTGVPGSAVANSGEGGGADGCILSNCVLTANYANTTGGGANVSVLKNCAVTANVGVLSGGGVNGGTLINCTVARNSSGNVPVPGQPGSSTAGNGAGVSSANLTNCIVYGNTCALVANVNSNYYQSSLSFSCSAPLPAGTGNIAADPQLLGDGVHLSVGSPCRAAGAGIFVTGADIDGQAWANPPAMGCDEWLPTPIIAGQPKAWIAGRPVNLNVGGVIAAGQEPFTFAWAKDGSVLVDDAHYDSTGTTNLLVKDFTLADVGGYQVVASNAFGMATSAVFQVVVHCVNGANPSPSPPFTDWASAATNIQDAIDVALEGEFVLVTNGVYATGSRVVHGDLANRVAVARSRSVLSVNGASATVIQGAWDPSTTNGPLAMRCAWLADRAALNGFTLQGGATRSVGDAVTLQSGGGALCASNTCLVSYCVISYNAAFNGGGCYQGVIDSCFLTGNVGHSLGGGAANAKLVNCFVGGNAARLYGGGTDGSSLVNCTVTMNAAGSTGGGVRLANVNSILNSVIYFNTSRSPQEANWGTLFGSPLEFSYSCTTPMPTAPGISNTTADPQFVDAFHLATTSPCRSAGTNLTAGFDLDGDAWLIPPSMGCDEVVASTMIGPLAVAIEAPQTELFVTRSLALTGRITGRAARLEWSFGDGPSVTNASYFITHGWTSPGDYMVTFTAFNPDNPGGVTTNFVVHVIPLEAPVLTTAGLSGTNFQFQFSTQTGASNTVEYATNLSPPVVWNILRTLVSTGPVMTVTDSAATNDARFYRVRSR